MVIETQPPHFQQPAGHASQGGLRHSLQDKLLEHSFYIASVALVAVMESYSLLTSRPRMLWAYFALLLVAVVYAVLRTGAFTSRDGSMIVVRQRKSFNKAQRPNVHGNESGAVRVAGRAPGA